MKSRLTSILVCAGFLYLLPGQAAAQWMPTNGPEGCQITALAVSGSSVYAGTSGHGVFKSADNGMSWRAARSGLPSGRRVDTLVVNGTTLFVLMNYRLYLSADGGARWMEAGPDKKDILCLEASGERLFAGTADGGIYISKDAGVNWSAARPRFSYSVDSLAAAGTELLVSAEGVIYVCPDCEGSPAAAKLGLHLAGSFLKFVHGATELVASTRFGSYVLRRGAQGWMADRITFPEEDAYAYCFALCGPNLVAGTGHGAFLSGDNGATWTEVRPAGGEGTRVSCLASTGNGLFAGTEDGLFLSRDNGASWAPANSGFPSESVVLNLFAFGPYLFAHTRGGVFRSPDNGSSWTPADKGLSIDGSESGFASSGGELYFFCSGRLYRSTDNGSRWAINFRDPEIGLALAAGGDHIFVSSLYNGEVILSHDKGATWVMNSSPGAALVTCLVMSGTKLFAGTGGFGKAVSLSIPPRGTNSVHYSLDDGRTWISTKARFSSSVGCMAVIGTNLFVGTDRGLYLCADQGDCPKPLKLKLSKMISVKSLVAVGTDLYAGTDKGVFLFRGSGGNWKAVNTGFPGSLRISCLARLGPYLFAGTEKDGVWRLPLSELK